MDAQVKDRRRPKLPQVGFWEGLYLLVAALQVANAPGLWLFGMRGVVPFSLLSAACCIVLALAHRAGADDRLGTTRWGRWIIAHDLHLRGVVILLGVVQIVVIFDGVAGLL